MKKALLFAVLFAGMCRAYAADLPYVSDIAPVPTRADEVSAQLRSLIGTASAMDVPSVGAAADAAPSAATSDPAQDAALARVRSILSYGGGIPQQDKSFMEEWFPKLLAKGLIGRAPTDFERKTIDGWFPDLAKKDDWRITAEACKNYNCIAWSAGITGEWEWPGDHVADFDKFYLSYGYVPLSDGEPQSDADIAYWELPDGSSTHGSRHVAGDIWESKLGSAPRILHHLNDLQGPDYGHVAKFYRRATPQELASRGVTSVKTPDGNGKDPCATKLRKSTGAYDIGSPDSKLRR